tara:strand:- start:1073 stop:1447 length:375 start_codon:yes stop_codon:yes gene_type:complete
MKKLFLFFILFSNCNQNQNLNIEPNKVYDLLSNNNKNNSILLDVRTEEEFIESKINNSLNIDFYSDNFKISILSLDKSKTYYVYCRSGRRSLNTVEFMRENGFSKSYNVDGGIIKWTDLNLPLK